MTTIRRQTTLADGLIITLARSAERYLLRPYVVTAINSLDEVLVSHCFTCEAAADQEFDKLVATFRKEVIVDQWDL